MGAEGSLADLWPAMEVRQLDLPTPTVQAHAANLLALPDGGLLCAWFGGTQEGLATAAVTSEHDRRSGVAVE